MTEQQIIDTINERMVEEFELDADKMTPDAHLIETLGLDSLDFVDMVVLLKEAFNISLREEPRVREIRTLGDLHQLVLEKAREMNLVTD